MEDLYAKLQRYVREQPSAHPAEAAAPDELLDWHAELGREHGLTLRRDVLPMYEHAPADEPSLDWRQEMLREYGVTRSRRPLAPGLGIKYEGSGELRLPLDLKDVPVPRSFAAYRLLLHGVFDLPKQRLAEALAREPICRAAFDVWDPRAVEGNLNVVYEVYDRVSAIMGGIYRFRPASLGYAPDMTGIWGLYNPKKTSIMLSRELLIQPANEFFATVIHEQIHALQHDLQRRLHRPGARALTPEETALAYYWTLEDRIIERLYAQAFADMKHGRGDAAYRRIAKEYHAFDTEESVLPYLVRSLVG